jgi:hypothetical protein
MAYDQDLEVEGSGSSLALLHFNMILRALAL